MEQYSTADHSGLGEFPKGIREVLGHVGSIFLYSQAVSK
jgi:hypothetical protein